jgi:hypothetical protein
MAVAPAVPWATSNSAARFRLDYRAAHSRYGDLQHSSRFVKRGHMRDGTGAGGKVRRGIPRGRTSRTWRVRPRFVTQVWAGSRPGRARNGSAACLERVEETCARGDWRGRIGRCRSPATLPAFGLLRPFWGRPLSSGSCQ